MTTDKRVEFHQAQVTVTVRFVDAEANSPSTQQSRKSHGTRQFSTTLLLNTDAEWADARKRIEETMEQLRKQLAEAEGNDGDGD